MPGLLPGDYTAELWDTRAGVPIDQARLAVSPEHPACETSPRLPLPPIGHDLAIAIKPLA